MNLNYPIWVQLTRVFHLFYHSFNYYNLNNLEFLFLLNYIIHLIQSIALAYSLIKNLPEWSILFTQVIYLNPLFMNQELIFFCYLMDSLWCLLRNNLLHYCIQANYLRCLNLQVEIFVKIIARVGLMFRLRFT